MKFDQLPAVLQDWLRTMHQGRYTKEATLQALLAAKYEQGYATRAIEAAWHSLVEPVVPEPAAHSSDTSTAVTSSGAVKDAGPIMRGVQQESRALSAQLVESPNSLDTSDRAVEMLFVMASPRVVLFGNLLSDDECDLMIEQSRTKLQRSSVVNATTGAYDVHPHRTSSGTHFQRGENELIRRIEARIAELVEYPVENGEPIQILHYQRGGEYKPHFDYFDPALPGNQEVLTQGGQRIATLIMYLNDVGAGGSTVFPEIGLDVLPRRGHAIYFAYSDDTGTLDKRTLHGGSPISGGEKWIATKWFRQRAYVGPGA